ncbi:MAG TPA: EVE domain-containing protein, partial [Chitinophagales bacterium]|nr:EVE domain-containing protein [Chitinophagales bacterium]
IESPLGVDGIPTAQAQRVWLFPPEYLRVNNEVSRLWNLFKKELEGDIDDELFADALNIKNVGRAKLTEALFYINPEKYLPINGPTIPYIREVLGLDYEFITYSEYMGLLETIRKKSDLPFYELSHEAWVWNKTNGKPPVNVIQSMIDDYKKHITKKRLEDEVYKWKLLEEYKGRPDLEAKNLQEEIKSINYSNLMFHLSKAVINELTEVNPDEIRSLFVELFDESVDLTERIKAFSKQTNTLYKTLGKTNQHHQDERSISTYLTFHNPEKYTFYKYSYYNSYCKLLGIKKAKINERYAHYLSLIDDLVEKYIKPDNELIEQVKSYVPQYYDGTNHKLLAQDVLFQTENMSAMVNYWIFQGNPKQFDFESAMKEEAVETWTVTAHKSAIKEGDKVIIWITGENAGCYALAEVTSKPYEKTSAKDDKYWMEENKNNEVVDIKITHNIVDYPLLKDEIDAEKELTNLKVGNQGTNFAATKEEYEKLLELAMNREDKRYWLYSPGEQAQNWEEFYNNEIMGLGWDELVDLKSYKSKDEIKEALDKAYGGDGSKKNDTTANDEFANVMQAGDIVIAKKGWYELLGYGLVTSDYIFDETRKEYKHIRKMDWKLNGNWYIEDQMVPKTLTDITPYETEDPDYDTYYERLLGVMGVNENGPDDSQFFEIKSKFDSEYGPTLFQNFINYLRKIISELDLKPNDERIVYS